MSRKPRLYLAIAAVVALMAVVPATSSAASFWWGNVGSYGSNSLGTQVITFPALSGLPSGEVKCNNQAGGGSIKYTSYSDLDLYVKYTGCSFFGFSTGEVSEVHYRYYANGRFDILSPLTISLAVFPLGQCKVTVPPQSNLGSVAYENNYNRLRYDQAVEGIAYSGEGFCASAGSTDATLTGLNELGFFNGGTINWYP